MYRQSRPRITLSLVLAFCLLFTSALVAAGAGKSPARTNPARNPQNNEDVSVAGVDFLGMVTFETGHTFADTEVGGLSSITYDPRREVYYTISDDPSAIDPARFYTMAIDIADGQLEPGDATFLGVTTLLNEDGDPFAPNALDPEGIVLGSQGYLFVSSEGFSAATPPVDPFIYRYNLNGRQTATLPVPHKFLPRADQGVRQNLAFESLTVTPDRHTLFTVNEGALVQDGPAADLGQETLTRIIQYDARQRRVLHEYVYVADPVVETPDPPDAFRVSGVVELLALDNAGSFLVMERSFSVGAGNTVKLYEADIDGATDVADVPALVDPDTGQTVSFVPLEKELLLNFADLGIVPDNIEGMTLGPTLPDGRHTLLIVSDNNFAGEQITQVIALALTLE